MKKFQFALFCLAIVSLIAITLNSCTKEASSPTDLETNEGNIATDRSPIVHRVSVGGADFCVNFGLNPGCDGNFSLIALMNADGDVWGQYSDQFGHGNGGFHATVNCLTVVGNEAWVSGTITSGTWFGDPLEGLSILTHVVDNGQTGDQISYSYIGTTIPCTDQPETELFDMTGQVKVW